MCFKDYVNYFRIKRSGDFDSGYYLIHNPDVRISDVDPLMHFVKHGSSEGRDPNSNFKCEWYLEAYEDVKQSNINPLIHYIKYGQKEGRLPSWGTIALEGKSKFEPTHQCVLVVSHEAELTDNLQLSLNLIQYLNENFNVISLNVKGGSVIQHFEKSSILTINPYLVDKEFDSTFADFILNELVRKYEFYLAIVNSGISNAVLPALAKRFIPTINLINVNPENMESEIDFPLALLWAHKTIFSSSFTFQRIMEEYPKLSDESFELIQYEKYQPLIFENKKLAPSYKGTLESHKIQALGLDQYFTKLVNIGLNLEKEIHHEMQDVSIIKETGVYRPDFYPPKYKREIDAIIHYVRSWRSGVNRWKLFPGFHPGRYLEEYPDIHEKEDPLAHYIRNDMPDGPWKSPVISNKGKISLTYDDKRIGLHLHVYYPDLLPEILTRLRINKILPDLFISVPSKIAHKQVFRLVKQYKGSIKVITTVPNRGRDIGAFITEFSDQFLAEYDIIGHIHTKKSFHLKFDTITKWRNFLFENLLGGSFTMADIILSKMMNNPSIGLVFPDDPNIFGWKENLRIARQLSQSLGISNLPTYFNFPVGTMFWARVDALRPLFELNLEYDDYPEEPAPLDASILHAIERLLPFVSSKMGYINYLTNVEGFTI